MAGEGAPQTERSIWLRVAEARPADLGRGVVRIDPADWAPLGARSGDVLQLALPDGATLPLKLLPAFPDQRGQQLAQLDWLTRRAGGLHLGDSVELRRVEAHAADEVWLQPVDGLPLLPREVDYLAGWIDGLPMVVEQVLQVDIAGRSRNLKVRLVRPEGTVVVTPETRLKIVGDGGQLGAPARQATSYEDVGGLSRELEALREVVELPLRHPDVFRQLGISPPRGVLLHGPPGTGKTLLARAIADESDARFLYISAPEIVHKHYGESEARLRELFDRAQKQAPAVVFIDEIDAIAPRRDLVQGEVEKRVVAQLLTLMDGLSPRGQVIVLAATNLPQVLDPALRRPGRFDREVAIGIPDRASREAILAVHTRGMPLAPDVDLARIAADAKGYTGADLRALVQEAGLRVARRVAGARRRREPVPHSLQVTAADFEAALAEITPTAMRQAEVEVPDTPLSRVGGLEAVKQLLRECLIWPIEAPELFAHYGVRPSRGVLLHGPPGTGKTLLARAVATEARANFLSVSGPSLLSRYVGDSERAVRELFQRARQASPAIIFFDEFDALAPARGRVGGGEVSERVVAQLLTEIDGLSPRAPIWLMAATNRLDLIDPALLRPGRFDYRVEIPLPDAADRLSILRTVLSGRPVAESIDLSAVASATEGFSGAELTALVDEACMNAIRRGMGQPESEPAVTAEDLDRALQRMQTARRRS